MMELGLSLGDHPQKSLKFLDQQQPKSQNMKDTNLGFCMALGTQPQLEVNSKRSDEEEEEEEDIRNNKNDDDQGQKRGCSADPVVQLDLLPFSPVPRTKPTSSHLRFPWPLHTANGMNWRSLLTAGAADGEAENSGTLSSSPNSTTVSSYQMESGMYKRRINGIRRNNSPQNKRDFEATHEDEMERANSNNSRGSDEDENGLLLSRKKLRLTKDQSAFLEDSFKEHATLNPKQKLALARQLNLRPRQVEVWFQNRRARTKLKQTEVDCEYLKRCCETLTEENRRLQKELQELRALKSSKPFYMQLPATTLTMCPSCERVATNATAAKAASSPASTVTVATTTPMLLPFLQDKVHALQASS